MALKENKVCPACKGKGFVVKFSIPKEDLNKGFKGYELWSCNKINGEYGCVRCGGSGVIYKVWYLNESPELRGTESEIIIGKGYIEESENIQC